jgi:hypothetical protein
MINLDEYLERFDYATIIDKILSESGIPKDDNHYLRHVTEIKKKIEECKKNFKKRDYLRDMPIMDRDFSYYVISKYLKLIY